MEFINNKINKVSRDFLLSLISFSDKQARKATRKEILDLYSNKKSGQINLVPMIATIKINRTIFNEPLNFHIEVQVEGSNTTPQISESRIKAFNSSWIDDQKMEFLMEKIGNEGITINIKIIKENKILFNSVESIISININKEYIGNSMEEKNVKYKEEIIQMMTDKVIGNIEFEVNLKPIDKFGLRYWDRLPVFDPDLKIPKFAMPSDSFVHHDEFNEIIVAFVIVYWLLRGEKNSMEMLPPNIQTRSAENGIYNAVISDQLFTSRRLNGCNRPYNDFIKVDSCKENNYGEWNYELKLDLSDYEIKPDIWFPKKTSCRFKLENDGELVIKSIAYQMNNNNNNNNNNNSNFTVNDNDLMIVQQADGSKEWNELKVKYMMVEFNYNINWGHVGVHFIVEMFNMAFYRNIVNNPIKQLLYPHFDGVIFNNWLVVRPMIDGVVTQAAAFTYEGQIQMLQKKFKEVSYRWKPTPIKDTIKGHVYDIADQAIWNAITEYVDEWFSENKDEVIKYWNEIELVSKDLTDHSLNQDRNENEINSIQDLRDCSIYIIYQAVFSHAYIHWKAWDEEAKAIIFNEDGATSKKDIQYYENLGNAIEAGVQYPSPYVRQYPILDIEFGGPELLQNKIWKYAHKINPAISIGSLIMSPNI
ncbi:hypothetical protein RB653_002383 [Dictyostelium firmibasis]|uniref:Lipoxygenase domain-containing protein n=1 Tax=Dictyostelium firmibasis TaxID=79012 RepID=A0AAN7TNR9_9MYCE